jgi:BASS family bile acid:Na+ symporter
MDSPVLTAIVLPAAIAVIMCNLGMTLTAADFRRVIVAPRGVAVGMLGMALLAPLLAMATAKLFALTPELAVGLVLVAASPGGMTANMLTHLSRGDTALSITMTALSSVGAIVTVPIFIAISSGYFGAGDIGEASMLGVVARVFAITIVPVAVGVELKRRRPTLVGAHQQRFRNASLVLFGLVVVGAIASEYDTVGENLAAVGGAALTLNLAAMATGFATSKLARLPDGQATAISLSLGIHNAPLAVAVGASLATDLAVPAAVYATFMVTTGGGFAWAMGRRNAAAGAREPRGSATAAPALEPE